jgi:hypothetical protein
MVEHRRKAPGSRRSATAVRPRRSATAVRQRTAAAVRTSPDRVTDAGADASAVVVADPVVVARVGPPVRAGRTRVAARGRATVPWRP